MKLENYERNNILEKNDKFFYYYIKVNKKYKKKSNLNLFVADGLKYTNSITSLYDLIEIYQLNIVDVENVENNILREFYNVILVSYKKNVEMKISDLNTLVKIYSNFTANNNELHPLLDDVGITYNFFKDNLSTILDKNDPEFSILFMKKYLLKNNKDVLSVKVLNSILKNASKSKNFDDFVLMIVESCQNINKKMNKDILLDLFTLNQWLYISKKINNIEKKQKIIEILKTFDNEIINNCFFNKKENNFLKLTNLFTFNDYLKDNDKFYSRDEEFFKNYIQEPLLLLNTNKDFIYKSNLININQKLEEIINSNDNFLINDANSIYNNIFKELIEKTFYWSIENNNEENHYLLEIINDLDNYVSEIHNNLNKQNISYKLDKLK